MPKEKKINPVTESGFIRWNKKFEKLNREERYIQMAITVIVITLIAVVILGTVVIRLVVK